MFNAIIKSIMYTDKHMPIIAKIEKHLQLILSSRNMVVVTKILDTFFRLKSNIQWQKTTVETKFTCERKALKEFI